MRNRPQVLTRVSLIGMMGSGKSTVGRALAGRLGWEFFDTDAWVEERVGKSISEIFDAYGEAFFRQQEKLGLAAALDGDYRVIATGGGVVLDSENRHRLVHESFVVWLDASPKTLAARVADGAGVRPLLAGSELVGRLKQIYNERKELYSIAHLRLCTDGLELGDVLREILSRVNIGGEASADGNGPG